VASQDLALNPDWRKRIAQIGKQNFVREEMLRLGFVSKKLSEEDRARIQGFLDQAYPRLKELKKDLAEIRSQIDGINNIESLLKEIRRERIERVKREREERKILSLTRLSEGFPAVFCHGWRGAEARPPRRACKKPSEGVVSCSTKNARPLQCAMPCYAMPASGGFCS
jgi:hypothetical protein